MKKYKEKEGTGAGVHPKRECAALTIEAIRILRTENGREKESAVVTIEATLSIMTEIVNPVMLRTDLGSDMMIDFWFGIRKHNDLLGLRAASGRALRD